jgi:hypothetical protein
MFSFVWVDELFRLAEAGQEVRYSAGRSLMTGAGRPDVHLLLEGTVRMGTGAEAGEVTAPAVIGAGHVLRGAALTGDVHATTPVIALHIGAAEFLTMVSDNALLAQGLFHMLLAAAEPASPIPEEPLLGAIPDAGSRRRPVDTALLLRRHPFFAHASASQLMALQAAAREVPLTGGQALFEPHDPSACILTLDGALALEFDGRGPQVAGPESVLGVAGTLAGAPWRQRAVVTRPGRALRVGRDDLFDVLTEHVDLLQGLFGAMWDRRRAGDGAPPPDVPI